MQKGSSIHRVRHILRPVRIAKRGPDPTFRPLSAPIRPLYFLHSWSVCHAISVIHGDPIITVRSNVSPTWWAQVPITENTSYDSPTGFILGGLDWRGWCWCHILLWSWHIRVLRKSSLLWAHKITCALTCIELYQQNTDTVTQTSYITSFYFLQSSRKASSFIY